MSIDFQRAEYEAELANWRKIQNVVDGKDLTKYIYDLNPDDTDEAMIARNKHFKGRAVFYPIASYTVRGFLGLVFDTPPKVELPTMEYLHENADGSGVGIVQQAQDVVNELIRVGRAFLWVDYPDTGERGVSLAEQVSMGVYATIQLFRASDVFFWSTRKIGAEVVLDDVRLWGNREIKNDDLSLSSETIIIRLLLDESNTYTVQTYVQSEKNEWMLESEVIPRDGRGNTLSRIPGTFVGSETNTWRIDEPPLNGIASLNVAHYNASAYHWDSVRLVGQPQPWISGIGIDQAREMIDANIYFGCGTVIPVDSGERFGIESADPNNLATMTMQQTLEMLIGLGAMFIQPGIAVKTATQSQGEQRIQHSVLSLIAANVSDAYMSILKYVAMFNNVELGESEFELNQDYVESAADPQMLREVIAGYLQGAIPATDYHSFMVKHDMADEQTTVDEYMELLAAPGGLDLDASSTSNTV